MWGGGGGGVEANTHTTEQIGKHKINLHSSSGTLQIKTLNKHNIETLQNYPHLRLTSYSNLTGVNGYYLTKYCIDNIISYIYVYVYIYVYIYICMYIGNSTIFLLQSRRIHYQNFFLRFFIIF